MRTSSVLTLAASVSSATALYKGFNYGSTNTAGTAYTEADYEDLFTTAAGLVGTDDFTSARLYTMIQGGTTDTIISAIPAAISTQTKLLLGMWCSAGQSDFDLEVTALMNAITQYGDDFTSLVIGISVGSEDLYRDSEVGYQSGSTDPGASPATLMSYISQVKGNLSSTGLSGASIGHVDTWNSWSNTSNSDLVTVVDFLGMDAYPYFQNTYTNPISDGASLFSSALEATVNAADGKDVWVTETGWPVSGATENEAVPSVANAQTYWDDVGCDILFGKYNTFWYTLQDYGSSPSFGVVGETLSTTPLYDLSCNASSSTSSSASSSKTSTSSVASATTETTATTTSAAAATTSTNAASSETSSTSAAATSAVATPVTAAAGSSAASTTVTTVTTGSTTSVAAGGKTLTVYRTTLLTITSCGVSTVCASTLSTATATTSKAASSVVASSTSASASSSSTSCPANLDGDYQYPHLIVPVDSAYPTTAYGTQYDGYINSTVSTIFNFDIPESYSGKTCSLVFLFPELSQLETSSYTWNGEGGIASYVLSEVANSSTTYDNQGSKVLENGAISSLEAGNSYVLSTDTCPPGTTVAFELVATGGLALSFFEDYNPSPLGLYVRAC